MEKSSHSEVRQALEQTTSIGRLENLQFWEFSRSDWTKSWVAWSELSMDPPVIRRWDCVTSQGHNTHHEYTWSVFSSLFPVRKGWRVVNSRQVVILTSRRPATIPTTSCHLSRELITISRTCKQFQRKLLKPNTQIVPGFAFSPLRLLNSPF